MQRLNNTYVSNNSCSNGKYYYFDSDMTGDSAQYMKRRWYNAWTLTSLEVVVKS